MSFPTSPTGQRPRRDVVVRSAQHTHGRSHRCAPYRVRRPDMPPAHGPKTLAQGAPLLKGAGETAMNGSPRSSVSSVTPACISRHRLTRSLSRPSAPRLRRTSSSPVSANTPGDFPGYAGPRNALRGRPRSLRPEPKLESANAAVKGLHLHVTRSVRRDAFAGTVSFAPSRRRTRSTGS
jgi:hypothetical protein